MKKYLHILFSLYLLFACLSCGSKTDRAKHESVDSLNELSSKMLYISASESERLAYEALELCDGYEDGVMESKCNIASALTMKMEYDSASVIFNDVKRNTDNYLYKFLADVGMMKICQATASYKEFYEYRTDALKRMERIKEDEGVMTEHQRLHWKVTNCLYNLTLSSHYKNLRYEEQINEAKEQYLYWYESLGPDTVILAPMFESHDLYFWKEYGNKYYESMALIYCADTLALSERYYDALDSLDRAINCINDFYGFDNDEGLHIFDIMNKDSLSKEMKWINDPDMVTIPEWMAAVRQELSIVYGAMGMKDASDYNHNIYFDILDATRQDMSMNERQERLEHEDRMMNVLLVSLAVMLILIVWVLVFISRKVTRMSEKSAERKAKLIELCKKMTSAMPLEAMDEEDVASCIYEAVDSDVKELFPTIKNDWTTTKGLRLDKFDQEMLTVVQVLYRWILKNCQVIVAMTEEKERVEGERYRFEKHIEDNKRQYIDKSTSVSIVNGITPFLDRVLREVGKLEKLDIAENKEEMNERLVYVKELVEKIDAFNDVLGYWVKMRQGAVTLSIENFAIQPLFDTLAKGRTMFDNKNITLEIPDTDAVVKADASLTLFMMNTLMDNARKYTPEGGVVRVSAEVTDEYVEISVKDSGKGLSEEDQDTLNNNKVYDSTKIGVADDTDGKIRENKGFGFGLMNCKGIIEKYRKTNSLFGVCKFGVDSKLGEGSRFYFRLPKGVIRSLVITVALLVGLCGKAQSVDDSLHYCEHLQKAVQYYDSVYDCNVNRDYEHAIVFADSAIQCLNMHYLESNTDTAFLMKLDGENMPELTLEKEGFKTDYTVIIDIRNEVAIAALSLNRRHLYEYNNEIFTRLYKQLSDDDTLEEYCNSMQKSTANKQVIITLVMFLVFILLFAYVLLYFRHSLLSIFNVRQFLVFARSLFSSNEDLSKMMFKSVNDVKKVDAIGLAVVDVDSGNGRMNYDYEGDVTCRLMLEQFMNMCYAKKTMMMDERERFLAFPLIVDVDGDSQCIGALGMMLSDSSISEDDKLNLELIAGFYAMHLYFCSTRIDEQKILLEMRMDEMRRMEMEDSRIHVQNMVLDNYLSTIKHETMYYPGRIKQMAEAALKSPDAETLKNLSEITTYYKEVFLLLCSGASRLLEKRVFKREKVSVAELQKYAKKTFEKKNRKLMLPLKLEISMPDEDLYIMTDRIIAHYMIDTLLAGAFEYENMGVLRLDFAKSDKFIKFAFSDDRLECTEEQMAELFYADSIKYDSTTGELHGSQYLLLKQMVREHDEYSGHKGCRIFAEKAGEGTRIVMML